MRWLLLRNGMQESDLHLLFPHTARAHILFPSFLAVLCSMQSIIILHMDESSRTTLPSRAHTLASSEPFSLSLTFWHWWIAHVRVCVCVYVADSRTVCAPPMRWIESIHSHDGCVCVCRLHTKESNSDDSLFSSPSVGRSAEVSTVDSPKCAIFLRFFSIRVGCLRWIVMLTDFHFNFNLSIICGRWFRSVDLSNG